MTQQFELTLCNYARYTWLGGIGMLVSLGLAIRIGMLLPGSWGFLAALLVLGLCFYGVHLLLKRFTLRPARIEVGPVGLQIHYLLGGPELPIAFADVISYRDEQMKDGRELRFRLRSGQKVKLATNHSLGATGDYEALLRAVQATLAHYNATALVAISREKSFFEKPFATWLLAACGAALLWSVGQMLLHRRPISGSFFTSVGAFLPYLAMWYRARSQHRP
jgi:hypothetical protein